MKRGLVFIVAMMIGTIVFAQERKPGMKDDARLEHMKTVLSLNDHQYASIKDINKKYDERRKAFKSQTPEGQANHEAIRSLRGEERREVEAVLSPEQKTKWEIYRKEQAEKRKALGESHRRERAEKMKTELGLSDDQAKKMQELHSSFRSEIQKMNIEKGDRKNNKAFQKAKAEHDAAVRSILTPEQYQKWTDMRVEKKGHGKHGKHGRHGK
jgi:uncharacterized membrane protein